MHHRRLCVTTITGLLAAALLLFAGRAAAAWPEFRGPTGQGHAQATNLPVQWSATENVAWKAALPGEGWSSPVVADGRVYVTAAAPGQGDERRRSYELITLCLDARTGKQLWRTAVFAQPAGAPRIHKKNSHASPTPILHGDNLFVHFGHQGTACLDLAGNILWKNDRIQYRPVHGGGGLPVLVDGLLIFSCDGARDPFVVALDAATGRERWRTARDTTPRKAFSFCTPLVIDVGGQRQVVLPGSDAVFAYAPKTGKAIWRVRYQDGYSVVPRPVFGHGLVFVCTGFDRARTMAIRPNGRGDVTDSHVAWETNRAAPLTPSPLLIGDELYLISDGGVMSCLDARTGQVHYRERVGGNYSASPLYADGKIYLQSEQGEAVVVKPGKTFEVLARNDLGERSLASYAVADGALFIRTVGGLYRIQLGAVAER